jgi:outer membrane PBP1 activator LpoA protein
MAKQETTTQHQQKMEPGKKKQTNKPAAQTLPEENRKIKNVNHSETAAAEAGHCSLHNNTTTIR